MGQFPVRKMPKIMRESFSQAPVCPGDPTFAPFGLTEANALILA